MEEHTEKENPNMLEIQNYFYLIKTCYKFYYKNLKTDMVINVMFRLQ